MLEVIVLISLGLVWIIFATIQDLKKREISDWLNYSLIIFALGFRFFYSLFANDFNFLYQGLIGLGLFFVLGNILYYGKMFAGGDAKLMMALGAVLPLHYDFFSNLNVFVLFFVLFLLAGAVYGIISTFYLAIKNKKVFRKEFKKQFKENKRLVFLILILSLLFLGAGFFDKTLVYFGIVLFVLPYLYVSAKAIDESCMVRKIPVGKLTEGDWLYKDLKLGNKKIKAKWEGLNKKEINLIKKHKKLVAIRQGIPFTPAFFVAYVLLIVFWIKERGSIF